MPRPQSKQELLTQADGNYAKLLDLIKPLNAGMMTEPGVNGDWSVRDILTHLSAWYTMCFGWYQTGMAGEKPEMPAPGYTWQTTPDLNEKIFQENRHKPPQKAIEELEAAHLKAIALIESHTDEELFTKKRYKWTGTSSLGSYLVSCSSSHYDWAYKLINKWLRKKAVG